MECERTISLLARIVDLSIFMNSQFKRGQLVTPKPKTVLILGASGFLGSSLLFHMSTNTGLTVISASRGRNSAQRIDDYSQETLVGLLDRVEPDFIVNCVGVVGHDLVETNPLKAEEINVFLPERLAKLAQQRGLGLIHFSSDSVYSGNPEEAPFSEKSQTVPFSLYGRQKLESEIRVMQINPSATVLRINFFGWSLSGTQGMLDHFVSHGIAGTNPIGYSAYFASSLYVGELSRVVVGAMQVGVSGLFNVGSQDSLSKLRFGQSVFTRMGLDPKEVLEGNPSAWTLAGVKSRDLSMSSNLIESRLNISLNTQLEGIRKAFDDLGPFLEFWKLSHSDNRHRLIESSVR